MLVVLNQELAALVALGKHLVVHALEDGRGNLTHKLGVLRIGRNFDVFRSDHYIHFLVAAESLVHTRNLCSCHLDQTIVDHRSAEDVALADEVCHKRVGWLVVDIGRCSYLLNLSLAHHHDGVAQGQGFFLVVGYVDEGNAQSLVHFLQFQLHVLAHLQVECSKWFIEQEYFRLVHDGTGDGNALLLSTRKRVDVAVFVIAHVHHFQGTLHLRHDLVLRRVLEFQAESDVVKYIEVRKQGIFLEHRVHVAFVGWQVGNIIPCYGDDALCGCLESSQKSQESSFSASRRTENGHEFALSHKEVDIVEGYFLAKSFRHILYVNDVLCCLIHFSF